MPVRLSGTSFMDYQHRFDSRVDSLRGTGGFTYRRMYLTADFAPAPRFDSRLRLNADEGTVDARGPVLYIKDAWLRWRWHNEHRVWFGVMPPPAIQVAEGQWGFRSLERTLPDLARIVFTRDFGVRFDGPVSADGRLRYAAMLGNGADVRPETDRYKRVYGELSLALSPSVTAAVAANHAGYGDHRTSTTTVNGVIAFTSGSWRAGTEYFVHRVAYRANNRTGIGVSAWATAPIQTGVTAVGRYYYSRGAEPVTPVITHTALIGVAYSPAPPIRFIPNLHASVREGDPHHEIRGRLTVEVNL